MAVQFSSVQFTFVIVVVIVVVVGVDQRGEVDMAEVQWRQYVRRRVDAPPAEEDEPPEIVSEIITVVQWSCSAALGRYLLTYLPTYLC